MAVIENHLAPVAALHGGKLHRAVRSGPDGCAYGRGDVDASMELTLAIACDRVFALAEAAGNGPDDGPQRWPVDGQVNTAECGQ